ncbi:MAG: hypothetical protein US76_01590 [Parcubacteria group bacterium GW2011_GWA2_38_13b]|nr:MAG: hypothetical protein US76_01590 [Parcubacteria group bacterium GW2011_GWA2_38_13b]
MEEEKKPYFCFLCGRPMEELPHLPKEIISTLIIRLGCNGCNIVQEKNYLMRKLSPDDFHLNCKEYKEKLENK